MMFQSLQVRTQDELDVPGPVSSLSARATSAFSILVTWDRPEGENDITSYKLYYREVGLSTCNDLCIFVWKKTCRYMIDKYRLVKMVCMMSRVKIL